MQTKKLTVEDFLPMGLDEYVDWLLSNPITAHLIPLRGFLSDDPKGRKSPISGFQWKNHSDVEAFTAEEAKKHLRSGGWLAIRPKRGFLVVDLDEPDAVDRFASVYATETFAVKTTRGLHLYYVSDKSLSGREANLVLEKTDYLNEDHYVVAPYSEPHRVWNQISAITKIPDEFLLPPTAELKNIWKSGKTIYELKEGDGRNNLLFSIGRKLRLWYENTGVSGYEQRLEEALYRIAALFAEPLDGREVEEVLRSVFRTPHRMETEDLGDKPFRLGTAGTAGTDGTAGTAGTGDGFLFGDDAIPIEENPFAQAKPINEIAQSGAKREWFIHGICRRGDVVLLAGAPKSGKSSLVRSIAISATAQHQQPLPTQRGLVLWYMFEEYPQDVLELMEHANQMFPHQISDVLVCSVDTGRYRNALAYWLAGLKHTLQNTDREVVAVFVDVVGRLFGNVDINDYATVQGLIEKIRWAIRDIPNPPTVFLVHHTNKGSQYGVTPLGSQAFMGSCDVVILLDNEDGVTNMRVTGRGVAPNFSMKPTPLRYDANVSLYTGIGSDVPEALCELVQLIHSGKIHTIEQANRYQGGVFKLDIRRLLRRGVLLCPDGVNISTNKYSKELDRYLYSNQRNNSDEEHTEKTELKLRYGGSAHENQGDHTENPIGDLVNLSGQRRYNEAGAVERNHRSNADTVSLNSRQNGNGENGENDGNSETSGNGETSETTETAVGWRKQHSQPAWLHANAIGRGEQQDNRNEQRDDGAELQSAQIIYRQPVLHHEDLPEKGQRFGYNYGGGGEQRTAGGAGERATETEGLSVGGKSADTRETLDTRGQATENSQERLAHSDRGSKAKMAEKLKWEDIDMQEVKSVGVPTKHLTTPAEDWTLVTEFTHPPSLKRCAFFVYQNMTGKNIYRPSDFDPFSEDVLVDYSEAVENHFNEMKQKLGSQRLSELEPAKVVAEIYKKQWSNGEYSLQDVLSLHHYVMKSLGKEDRFFLFRVKGLPVELLAIIYKGSLYLVPLTKEEAEGGYPEWKRVYAEFATNRLQRKRFPVPYDAYEVLEKGYHFSRYRTPKGEDVYVLDKRRIKIENKEQFLQYLEFVFSLE